MIIINFQNIKTLYSAEKFLYRLEKEQYDIDNIIIIPSVIDIKDFRHKFKFKIGIPYSQNSGYITKKNIKNLSLFYALLNQKDSFIGYNSMYDAIKKFKNNNVRTITYSYNPSEYNKVKSLESEYIVIKIDNINDLSKFPIDTYDNVFVDYRFKNYNDIEKIDKKGVKGFIIKPYIKDFILLKNYYA